MIVFLALAVAVLAAGRGTWSPCGLSMLSTLNPVSEHARGHRFWLTALWYVLGALGGGALLGLGCALVSSLWGRAEWGRAEPGAAVTWALALGAALVAVGSDTRLLGWSLPDHPRQVDERWLGRYRRWIYASGYGVQIGTGFATYVMTAGVYLTVVLAALTGSARAGFAVGVVFGGVRGLSVLVAALARTPERLRAMHARLAGWAGASLAVCVAGSAGVAVVAAGELGGAAGAAGAAGGLAIVATVALSARRAVGAHPGG